MSMNNFFLVHLTEFMNNGETPDYIDYQLTMQSIIVKLENFLIRANYIEYNCLEKAYGLKGLLIWNSSKIIGVDCRVLKSLLITAWEVGELPINILRYKNRHVNFMHLETLFSKLQLWEELENISNILEIIKATFDLGEEGFDI